MTVVIHEREANRVTLLRFIAMVSNANQGRSMDDFLVPRRPEGVSQARWNAMCRYFWNHLGRDSNTLRLLGMVSASDRPRKAIESVTVQRA